MKICYLFRSKGLKQFSIENVFKYIIDELKITFQIKSEFVPEYRIGFSEVFKNLKYAKRCHGDIIHITGDIHYISLVLPYNKTILTIHDLVGLENNKKHTIKKLLYLIFWVLIPSIKCRYITTISNKTKEDFLKICPWAKNKTFMIPDPIDKRYKYIDKEFNCLRPRILLIGTSGNKNHERIIKAVKNMPCVLDIVGQLPEREKILLNELNVDYNNYYQLSDEEIIQRFINCDIVLFASIYEGFGMPIIEGQKTGRCVITSNIEPMCEVAGEGACLVNPYDSNDIRKGLLKIIGDNLYRKNLINSGLKNAEKYSAMNIAAAYAALYEKVRKN